MRFLNFSSRNRKEMLRDPLSLVFGIGFPVIMLALFSVLSNSIQGMPKEIFSISNFAPDMVVFGLSFITLFLGTLMANDRKSSFLTRLFSSPLKKRDYVWGYQFPMVIMAILQAIVCFIASLIFGLEFTPRIFLALVVIIPVSLLYISFGLLLGTFFSPEQVGGMGSMIVSVSIILSGTFFDLDTMEGGFATFCNILPFRHAVDSIQYTLSGDYKEVIINLIWVLVYAGVIRGVATEFFGKQMRY